MARILGALPRSVIAGYLYSSEFMGGPQLAQMARIFSSERRWSRLTSSGERPARGFPSLASMLLSVGNGGSSPLGAPLGDFGLGGALSSVRWDSWIPTSFPWQRRGHGLSGVGPIRAGEERLDLGGGRHLVGE